MSSQQQSPGDGPAPRRHRGLVLLAAGVALGIAADRLVIAPRNVAEKEQAAAAAVTRDGNRIVVPPGSPLRSRVVVADVAENEVPRTLLLPAVVEVEPARTVKVLPPVAGRVVELKVELGSRVVKDQALAVINSGDLAQAYSDEEKAQATVTLTKKALDRLAELEKTRAIAVKDREEAQNDYAQALSERERAETRLRAIGVAPEPPGETRLLIVKSPVTGSVTDMQTATGAFLNDATAEIMTIANLNSIWVTANVPEKDTSFVGVGQAVNVTFPAYPGRTFSGKVLFVSDVLDPDTRRTKVRIAFDNPDQALKPNMFATATFVAPPDRQLAVPTSALLLENDKISVFVEIEPWVFERREVDATDQGADTTTIRGGLKAGDRVIVRGGVLLGD